MITRKLSKAQGYTIQVLAAQLTQAQLEAANAQGALNEMAELYRISFELPEGEAQFGQNLDGWAIVVTPAPVVPAEPLGPGDVPVPDVDEDGDVIEPILPSHHHRPAETKAAEDESS